jgi:phosphoribosyl 1,2-cyclic phosphate phosphodiesterase
MKITILGSGTSTGVPEYRCDCPVCVDARAPGSRNYRTRPSISLEHEGRTIQFDTGPNFIDQIDRCQIHQIDSVVYTHCHADHITGANDLVMPCRKQRCDMPIYGPDETLRVLQRNCDYMFTRDTFQGGGVAHLVPNLVEERFSLFGLDITPIPVEHGAVFTFGYRIENVGYVPDAKQISDSSLELLQGVEVLILDALSFNPRHPTHLSVGESVAIVERLAPREAYFTHIMHRLDHRHFRDQCAENGIDLPSNTYLSYDGQIIEV